MKRSVAALWSVGLAALGAGSAGCDDVKDALTGDGGLLDQVRVEISGPLQYQGNVDKGEIALDFQLYKLSDNMNAIDSKGCPAGTGPESAQEGKIPECYGEVIVENLDHPVTDAKMTVAFEPGAASFRLQEVPADVGYILVVKASAPDASCSTDIVGYEEQSKLIKRESVLSPAENIASGGDVELPRPVRVSCDRVAVPDEPEPPPPPPAPPSDVIDDTVDGEDGDLPAPKSPQWTLFQLLDAKDASVLADASAAVVPGANDQPPCGTSMPMTVKGAIDDFDGDRAYIHIQEGRGANAIIRDQVAAVSGGQIDGQVIQLSGGYARIQLDTKAIDDPANDFTGASYFVEVCSPSDEFVWPKQELLTVVSWDTDGTDVDTHVWVEDGTGVEDHIWYSRREGTHADLDVDDVNGYGPETVTSKPGESGLTYDIKLFYYSDHGYSDPPTNALVRVIYSNEAAGVYCDNAVAVPGFQSYAWQAIGRYGPELVALADSDAAAFTALGCRKP